MNRYIKYLVFLSMLFLPINVFAFELRCDNGEYQYGSTFSCQLIGEAANYSKLTGVISTDDSLKCERDHIAGGLVSNDSNANQINLSGESGTSELLSIKCEVAKKLEEKVKTQVSIANFAYQMKGASQEQTEIIRSDYIHLTPHIESNPVDTKPRDVSNSDNRLKTLTSKDLNLTFSQFITKYYIEVLYETESVELAYTLNNPESKVRVEKDEKLKVGNNIIDIYVTNPDGTKEACYTITVNRLARGEEIYYPERDSALKEMTITGYSINFEPEILEYKIHLTSDVNKIRINALPKHSKATLSISETDNLKNGSIVSVTVTSEDESTSTTYKIKITKDAPKKDYSTLIIASLLGIALIGAIVWFIISAQKKKNNDPLLSSTKKKKRQNKGEQLDVMNIQESIQNPMNNANITPPNVNNNQINNQQQNLNQTPNINNQMPPQYNQNYYQPNMMTQPNQTSQSPQINPSLPVQPDQTLQSNQSLSSMQPNQIPQQFNNTNNIQYDNSQENSQ